MSEKCEVTEPVLVAESQGLATVIASAKGGEF